MSKSKLNNFKKINTKHLINTENSIEALRAEIEVFQMSIMGANGKLPKKFSYPDHLCEKVIQLKSLGFSTNRVALALGISHAAISNWFNSTSFKKTKKKKTSPFDCSIRELKLQSHPPVISQNPENHISNARVFFKSGVVIELDSRAITLDLVTWISKESLSTASIGGNQ